jgi:hypothetical protein
MIAKLTSGRDFFNAQPAVERVSLSSSGPWIPVLVLPDGLHPLTLRFGSFHLKKMNVPEDSKQAAVKPPSYHSGSGSFGKDLKAPSSPEQRCRQSISDSMLVLTLR